MYKQIILSKEMIIYYYMIINVNDILCKVSILQIYFIHTRIYRVPGVGLGCSGEISGSAHVLFCDTATQYCTIVHVTNCMLVLGSR